MQKEHQKCLNKGDGMLDCSVNYYKKVDSLLNVVYKKIKRDLSNDEQRELTKNQQNWVRLKDSEFVQIAKDNSQPIGDGVFSEDNRMICLVLEADFICKRILELEKMYGVVK